MNDFVIVVDFRLKPGAKAAFLRLINDNARASCREERGCRRFDVLAVPSEADRIVLYEIYDGRAAFDAHLATCSQCRSELEELRGVTASFVFWPTNVMRPPAPLARSSPPRCVPPPTAPSCAAGSRLRWPAAASWFPWSCATAWPR